jgi:hypothetical protein
MYDKVYRIKMAELANLLATKQAKIDEIAIAEALPETYATEKARIITRNQNMITRLENRIAALQAEEARLQDQEYQSLKQYGENLSIEALREIKAIVDDTNLTQEQKCMLVCCKGGAL